MLISTNLIVPISAHQLHHFLSSNICSCSLATIIKNAVHSLHNNCEGLSRAFLEKRNRSRFIQKTITFMPNLGGTGSALDHVISCVCIINQKPRESP